MPPSLSVDSRSGRVVVWDEDEFDRTRGHENGCIGSPTRAFVGSSLHSEGGAIAKCQASCELGPKSSRERRETPHHVSLKMTLARRRSGEDGPSRVGVA